jgi:KRAB domain-containing zinc finger protein
MSSKKNFLPGSPRDRRKHELIHERGRNKTYCTYCKKYVSGNIVLHDHTVHANSLYECNVCKRKFPFSKDFQRHELKHLQRLFDCDMCGNSYSDLYHLRIHILTHKIENETSNLKTEPLERNYCCNICEKKFNLARNFARHLLIHEKVRDFECDICKKKFISKSDLRKHSKKHIDEGENYCKICKTQVFDLKEHYSIHFDMEFQCDECPKRFRSQSTLNYHKKCRHAKGKVYKCYQCEKTFYYISHLHKHLESHEKKPNKEEEKVDSPLISDDLVNLKLEPIRGKDLINIEHELKVEPMEFQLCSVKIKLEGYESHFEHKSVIQNNKFENIDDSSCGDDDDDDSNCTNLRNEIFVSRDYPKNNQYPLKMDGKKLRVTCRVCCATFKAISDYQDHFFMSHVDEEVKHHCKACKLSFDDRKKLQAHFRETHEIFKCENCRRQFISQFLLDEHKKEHEFKDRLMCIHCGKLYANRISLNAHTDAQHSNKRFECDMCDKSYSFKAALYKHRRWVHLEGKKHKCSECKYMARTKYEVKLHYGHHHTFQRTNAKEKYYCNICGITFPNASTLSRHSLIQHNGFVYTVNKKCVLCKEPVKKNQTFNHIAQVHLNGQRKLRQCGFCKIEIELFDDYIEHISSHPKVFICQICGDPFSNVLTLQNHLGAHKQLEKELRQYECDYCGQRKSNRAQIEAHMITHHAKFPKLHKCKICDKDFKLASVLYTHLKYHTGGSKACSYCDKKFVTNTDLVNHVRINHTHEKPFK